MVAEVAAALARDPKDVLLELLGPDRIVDPRTSAEVANYWNYGDPPETYPIETGRLRRVAESPLSRPDGASNCRRARASASPRIAVS